MEPNTFVIYGALAGEFERWARAALREVSGLASYPFPAPRRSCLSMAYANMKAALSCANEMGCPARKAMCLRVMNWLRADLRRLPA